MMVWVRLMVVSDGAHAIVISTVGDITLMTLFTLKRALYRD